jgi:hypothetical protein
MIDGDDKLRRRYRELPSEEPPAALDAAIRDAAHRAVAPKRGVQRWAVPVSLAAVLVLAVGVTLRMQQEQPGIETAPPVSEYSVPASPPVDQASPKPAPQAQPAEPEKRAEPFTAAKPVLPPPETQKLKKDQAAAARESDDLRASRRDTGTTTPAAVQEEKRAFAEGAAAPAPEKPSQPKAFADSADKNVAAPVAPPAPAASAASPPPARERQEALRMQAAPTAKTEAARAAPAAAPPPPAASSPAPAMAQSRAKADVEPAVSAKEAAKGPLERELDRIAQLRRDGRHQEADEALAKFRKDNPDYKIPEAIWDQVKPR